MYPLWAKRQNLRLHRFDLDQSFTTFSAPDATAPMVGDLQKISGKFNSKQFSKIRVTLTAWFVFSGHQTGCCECRKIVSGQEAAGIIQSPRWVFWLNLWQTCSCVHIISPRVGFQVSTEICTTEFVKHDSAYVPKEEKKGYCLFKPVVFMNVNVGRMTTTFLLSMCKLGDKKCKHGLSFNWNNSSPLSGLSTV